MLTWAADADLLCGRGQAWTSQREPTVDCDNRNRMGLTAKTGLRTHL